MHKLSHQVGETWKEYSHAPTFRRETTGGGALRIVAGLPSELSPAAVSRLIGCLEPPLLALYVLHTPRGDTAPGRYQSPELSEQAAVALVGRFSDLLSRDSRHDFWVHSRNTQATVAWDRHNLVHAYGPIECFEKTLVALGFSPGDPAVPDPHAHHYHEDLDPAGAELMGLFKWRYSPLRPGDEQVPAL